MGICRRLINEIEKLIDEGEKFKEEREEQNLLREYEKWTLSCIELFREIFGDESEHLNDFINDKVKGEKTLQELSKRKFPFLKKHDEFYAIVEHQIGILESAKYHVETGISNLKRLISFEFYREILKTAEFLISKDLKDPAAVLAYSILKILLEEKELLDEEDKLKYFYELGKSAVEGEFYLYDKEKVKEMLAWLDKIIKSQLDKISLSHY